MGTAKRVLALKNSLDQEGKEENVEIRHHDEPKEDGNEAPKFDAFIRRNAT